MESDNIHDEIEKFLGNLPENFNILEEQIDIGEQMEYFEYVKNNKTEIPAEQTLLKRDDLFNPDISIEDKRQLIINLSSIDKVEAYRTLEKYVKTPDENLRNWAILALQESRMLLHSSLLDEGQVFISTGLGGKGQKLRYFTVLLSKDKTPFNKTQQKVIQSEFEFLFKKHQIEIEKINFTDMFATILALIPVKVTIKTIFQQAIEECNQLGDFINANFIVTNVKELDSKEIINYLSEMKNNEK